MFSSPEARLKHSHRSARHTSHRRVFRILIFVFGRRRDVPGELAEAGRPAPRPRPSSVSGRALRRTRGQSTVAAREGDARVDCGVLGEEALDELEFLLLLPQEDVDQELLLPLELLHDGLGNVGDHPGDHEAEEHHQVLEEGERGGRMNRKTNEMDDRSDGTVAGKIKFQVSCPWKLQRNDLEQNLYVQ